MSKSKELLEWSNEIGLVAGMVFISNGFVIQIEKIEENLITFKAVNGSGSSTWKIDSFSQSYKLIFDPRSEKESPKMEKTFKQTLQENTQIMIDFRNEEDERVYRNFSENLKTELLNYTKKSDKFSYHSDNELAERFCKENGLMYEYVSGTMNRHKISWE